MKTTLLTSFVSISLASATIFANVIPFSESYSHGRELKAMNQDSSTDASISVNKINFDEAQLTDAAPLTYRQLVKRGDSKNKDNQNVANTQDLQYLNFALLVEDLLVSFFERGLSLYTKQTFVDAGYADWVRGRYEQIAEHERMHRDFIRSAITASGGKTAQPCTTTFFDNDVHAFVDLSEALETISTSAYTGYLQYLSNPAYITTAAAILAVEARHASWINSAVRKQNPWNTAFETPLTLNQVTTLLSPFFDVNSCPADNAALLPPVAHKPYPILSLSPKLVPGEKAEISFPPQALADGQKLYIAFLAGIETVFLPVEMRARKTAETPKAHDDAKHADDKQADDKKADDKQADDKQADDKQADEENKIRYFIEIPTDLTARGTVFVVLVHGPEDIRQVNLDDGNIVAGPAIATFPFDADKKAIAW